jgi:hypothetical protein
MVVIINYYYDYYYVALPRKPRKSNLVSFRELNSARQDFEIILNKFSKNTEMLIFTGFGKRPEAFFYENQSISDLFDFESSFQNCFWNVYSTSGSS